MANFCFLSFLLFAITASNGSVQSNFLNKKVSRRIDISTHLVKISTTINTVPQSNDQNYVFLIDSGYEDSLAFIAASGKVGDDEKEFVIEEPKGSISDAKYFNIKLEAASAQKPVVFTVTTIFTHKLVPYPSEIKQSEKQFVKFLGNLYFYTPYFTEEQDTVVILTSTNALSYTQSVKPVNKQDTQITYGPYANIEANKREELSVHYENNSPFLTVTSMIRHVELSHWGNIAIEETFDIYHSGAKLKGSFSRYDYQRNEDGVSSIKSFKTVLPAAARDVYYRDEIGNISTSHMRELQDSVELELRPRFPLFGGWKTHYIVGYNVPSYEYLFHKGNAFALKIRFVDHIYDDQVIDHATVKIVLPEGASHIQLKTPYPVTEGAREVLKTYLDIEGRTVIVVHKANLVEQHIQELTLYYTFNTLTLLREPIMVIVAFFILFSVVIVWVRLDFSVTKDEASESRLRVAGLIEEVQTAHDKRSALYQSYEDAVNKYKAGKDHTKLINDRKKIDNDHKVLCSHIHNLQSKLRLDSVEKAEKVNELQALDAKYKEQVNQVVQLAEKLVNGKWSRQQYMDAESKVTTKKEEIMGKMDSILTSL